MPRRNRKTQRQGKRGSNNRNASGTAFNSKQFTARVSGIEAALIVAENNGSIGILHADVSGVVVSTGGATMIMTARTMGPRLSQIAGVYNQWKVNRLRFTYKPLNFMGQYTSNDASTTFGGYPPLTDIAHITSKMAFGITRDPTVGTLSYSEVIESGGRDFNPARPFTYVMNGSNEWYYVDPRVSDTLSDLRFISPGQFNCVSYANGSANELVFGSISIEWDISFRYPLDADNGASAALTKRAGALASLQQLKDSVTAREESKESDSKVIAL